MPERAPSPAAHGPFLHRVARRFVRPRLTLSTAVFVALLVVLPVLVPWRWPTVLLVAWNLAVGLHLVLIFRMMARSDATTTQMRARRQDESALVILAISVAAASVSLLAIVAELAVVKDLTGFSRYAHIALSAATVFSAWTFIQVVFALHYAHAYALSVADGGTRNLDIPGENSPDYWDFLYVAVSIGTSGQTADVEFTGKSQRRVGTAHATLAFFFNATVLALTINIAAGLI